MVDERVHMHAGYRSAAITLAFQEYTTVPLGSQWGTLRAMIVQ